MTAPRCGWCNACAICAQAQRAMLLGDDVSAPTLIADIERVRDALDRVLMRPEVVPISSEVGNLLEAALDRVVGALLLARDGKAYTPDVVPRVRPTCGKP